MGSGKTAVAFLALIAAVDSKWQGAMIAPTEVCSSGLSSISNACHLFASRVELDYISSPQEEFDARAAVWDAGFLAIKCISTRLCAEQTLLKEN